MNMTWELCDANGESIAWSEAEQRATLAVALMAAFADVTVKVPALFIAGDHDMVMAAPPGLDQHLANLRQVVTTLRDVRILPGCGHWTQQERPEEVNTLLIDWLKRL